MSWMLTVTSKTARNGQVVGDIVAVYDFEPTATEKELFGVQKVENCHQAKVYETLNAGLDEKKEYPKFPFSIGKLTATDKANLAKATVDEKADIDILKKITPKTPIGVATL